MQNSSAYLFGLTTSGDIRDDTSTERSASTASTEQPNTARSYQNSDIRNNISPMVRTKQTARKECDDHHNGDDHREGDRRDGDD